MPRVKKQDFEISIGNGLGTVFMSVVFNVNSQGEFYCRIPEEALPFFEVGKRYDGGVICKKDRSDQVAIYATTLTVLESILVKALRESHKPKVTEEHVIRYNIESHVSFAEDDKGQIFPNAGFEGAEWPSLESEHHLMYGRHHAREVAEGGYSLTIGARALTKVTSRIGEKESITYKAYYKGASHHGRDNPAQLLNSWASFSLPKNAKEIPYSDDAAIFFHNMMLGMAKLSKQIQEATFHQDNLLQLIESKTLLLGRGE
ncbi:hypothetical protein NDJ14_11850 [Vibrio alginolyticus]|uniref:hypothetical protein n=1 Tax=Vibrio alginolyticus TaxID=663 RepID=UPI0021604F12|nr:hypothetical protein [Vibrio alginolyticus]MCS0157622.1 hypothetical protein [Vibrio alginolyticus]